MRPEAAQPLLPGLAMKRAAWGTPMMVKMPEANTLLSPLTSPDRARVVHKCYKP